MFTIKKQMLIGTENGNLLLFQIDYDNKKDTFNEKSTLMTNLKGCVYGIGVSLN